MNHLPEPDRAKLVKLLNLLSSNHVGECAAAGAAAHRFLAQRGLDWDQLLKPQRAEPRLSTITTWRDTCRRLLDRPRELSPWERNFVAGLPNFTRISPKQKHFLNEISRRVLGERA